MKTTIFLLLLLLQATFNCVFAQTSPIPDATFKIVSQIDPVSGDTIKYEGIFIIRGNQFLWGPDEQNATQFEVKNSSGSWNSETNSGLVTSEITFADFTGTVQFIGKEGNLLIEVLLDFEGNKDKSTLIAQEIIYK